MYLFLVVSFHHLRYEVISTPTSIYMVIEYAGGELFNYIVDNTRVNFSGFHSIHQWSQTHLERATTTKKLTLCVFNFTLFTSILSNDSHLHLCSYPKRKHGGSSNKLCARLNTVTGTRLYTGISNQKSTSRICVGVFWLAIVQNNSPDPTSFFLLSLFFS